MLDTTCRLVALFNGTGVRVRSIRCTTSRFDPLKRLRALIRYREDGRIDVGNAAIELRTARDGNRPLNDFFAGIHYWQSSLLGISLRNFREIRRELWASV